MRSEPQNIGLAFDVLTPKLSCLIRFDRLIFQTNVVQRVNSGKISHVVTCTTDCTCHHLTFPAKTWNFWENWAIWEKYKHLPIANDARLASLKAFFILKQRNIYTWLYVPVTGHITIRHILRKNENMRSEPQNFALAFDVLTPELSCLIRFGHLIFQTNVVQRVNSGRICLVVTCTADCTCHHLKIPGKNWNFWQNWSIWNKYKHLAIPNNARLASLKAF